MPTSKPILSAWAIISPCPLAHAAAENPLLDGRHGHAAALVDGLQDRLRERHRPHAMLAVWQQAALTPQLAFEGQYLQLVGRARRESLLAQARTVAHTDHVLRGEAQRRGDERRLRALDDQIVLGARHLACGPRHRVAVAAEAAEDGHGVVRFTPSAVRVGESTDLGEGLSAYPLNEVKQVHP